ncbi:MAG TPA: hypothetical protein VNA12_11085 [Mycobacteriales bacterium]|nr:hypothetical protein [Mycobacteriales bacterium]
MSVIDSPGAGPADAAGPAVEPPSLRPWFRRNPLIVLLGGVLVVVGNYFLGLIAIVLLAGDRTRDIPSRIGGAVLVFSWMFVWTLPGVSPYVGFTLFAIAAYYLLRSAWLRRRGDVPLGWRLPAALGAGAAVLAVVGLAPYGVRTSGFDEDEAARRVLAARTAGTDRQVTRADFATYGGLAFQEDFEPVDAAQRLVAAARFRFTNAPIYYVVLFEENSTTKRTGDGEPCFSASETLTIHGITGDVVNLGRHDALEEDGGCLRLLRGTRAELEPV